MNFFKSVSAWAANEDVGKGVSDIFYCHPLVTKKRYYLGELLKCIALPEYDTIPYEDVYF